MPLKKGSCSYCIMNSVINLIKNRWNGKIISLYFNSSKREPKQKDTVGQKLKEDNKKHNDGSIHQIFWDSVKPSSVHVCSASVAHVAACTRQLNPWKEACNCLLICISFPRSRSVNNSLHLKQRKPHHVRWRLHQCTEAQMLLAVLM